MHAGLSCGQALPFADATFDAGVMALVLFFQCRLRDLFERLPPAALHRLRERVREGLGAARTGPLAVRARANGVKGRRR